MKYKYDYDMTEKVMADVAIQPDGLKGRIKKYLEQLQEKGPALRWPFVDKIEGFKNLFELRPSFGNLEYRMIYFWKSNIAYFVHTFIEKGKKKKNQREYKTADKNKKELEKSI